MLYRGKSLCEKKRNGKIEQFGKITGNSNVEKEVNFPISFTELPILHSSPHLPDSGAIPYTTVVYKITKTAFKGLFLPREPNASGNGYAHT